MNWSVNFSNLPENNKDLNLDSIPEFESLKDMDYQFVEDTINEFLQKQKNIAEYKKNLEKKQREKDEWDNFILYKPYIIS